MQEWYEACIVFRAKLSLVCAFISSNSRSYMIEYLALALVDYAIVDLAVDRLALSWR